MPSLQLRNQFGQLDLTVIDPDMVAELSDSAQVKLAALIAANDARVAAQDRYAKAVIGVREAQEEQAAALEAHKDASDPFPFVPPSVENFATQAAYDAALREARERHDLRVRQVRQREAHLAAIAAYNNSAH
jgi:hypothetical protein